MFFLFFFFFKQKTAYEMRISDWSSDVCSSDLIVGQESGIDRLTAEALVKLAHKLRAFQDKGLAEVPSTRLLVATSQLIVQGTPVKRACQVALISPLSDDARSEERRVGHECGRTCRSRWSQYH